MDKKSAGIHPSMAHQPPRSQINERNIPHSTNPTPAAAAATAKVGLAHAQGAQGTEELLCSCSERTFPQAAGAVSTKELQPEQTGSIGLAPSHKSPQIWPQTFPLSTTRATLWPIMPSFPLHKIGSIRPLHPGFLHPYPFLKCKVQQLPHQVDFPMPSVSLTPVWLHQQWPCAFPPLTMVKDWSEHHKELPPPHNRGMCRASYDPWLKSEWGKWLNLFLNPRQSASLVAVLQLLAIPRWQKGSKQAEGKQTAGNLECSKGGDVVLSAWLLLTRNQCSIQPVLTFLFLYQEELFHLEKSSCLWINDKLQEESYVKLSYSTETTLTFSTKLPILKPFPKLSGLYVNLIAFK